MAYPYLCRILLLLVFGLNCHLAMAQNDSYPQQLITLQASQVQINTEIQLAAEALSREQKQALPRQTHYEKTQRELIGAQARLRQEPNPQSQSKLKNAEFKLALAEHKLSKHNAQLAELGLKQQRLQRQLTANQQAIEQLGEKQARQQWLQKQALSNQAQAEQALAEQAQQTSEQTAATATTTKPVLAADEQIPATAEQTLLETKTADSTLAVITTAPTAAARQPDTVLEEHNGISHLLNSAQIKQHQQAIQLILSADSQQHNSRNNRIMTIKSIGKTASQSRDNSLHLTPLGNNVYRGVMPLASGDTLFIIGFNRWRQTLPASAHDGSDYVIIFNNSVKKKPQLVYYPLALENQP